MIQILPEPKESDFADLVRMGRDEAFLNLSRSHRSAKGQFFTPYSIATFMASLQTFGLRVRILDPGAGVGALTLASIEHAIEGPNPPVEIEAVCVEIEHAFHPVLRRNMEACAKYCRDRGVKFSYEIVADDFILRASKELSGDLLPARHRLGRFSHAILNPPYKKLNSASDHRLSLRKAGIETSNLYAAFVWLAVQLLEDDGQVTAITPRSFCNGLYFRPFRQSLRDSVAFDHIHCIENRQTAFAEDAVLQENIIFHARKPAAEGGIVIVSAGDGMHIAAENSVPAANVIGSDHDAVIHLVMNDVDAEVKASIESLPCDLESLEIEVSTGPVVDFRAEAQLRPDPCADAVPLLYPCHFNGGNVEWPKAKQKKPNAILLNQETRSLLVPAGHYTLVKRFTAKEERKRVVAVVLSPKDLPTGTDLVGIENHINYFHRNREPLDRYLAWGLCWFLNSTIVDAYLRVFNGHTQINATDLRKLRYPSEKDLKAIGKECKMGMHQDQVDSVVSRITGLPTLEV